MHMKTCYRYIQNLCVTMETRLHDQKQNPCDHNICISSFVSSFDGIMPGGFDLCVTSLWLLGFTAVLNMHVYAHSF